MPFFRGNLFFFTQKQRKERKTTNNKNKTNKEGLGPSEVEQKNQKRKPKKTQKYQKISISVISHLFLFWWVSKISFFSTTWPKKRAPQNTINVGVSAKHFWKTDVRHETGIFGQQKPKFRNSSYHCFVFFFLLQQQKNPKMTEIPIF